MKRIQILLAAVSAVVHFPTSDLVVSAIPALTLCFQKVVQRTVGLKHFPAKTSHTTQERESFGVFNKLDESFPINLAISTFLPQFNLFHILPFTFSSLPYQIFA